jgi:hypothetical protein
VNSELLLLLPANKVESRLHHRALTSTATRAAAAGPVNERRNVFFLFRTRSNRKSKVFCQFQTNRTHAGGGRITRNVVSNLFHCETPAKLTAVASRSVGHVTSVCPLTAEYCRVAFQHGKNSAGKKPQKTTKKTQRRRRHPKAQ